MTNLRNSLFTLFLLVSSVSLLSGCDEDWWEHYGNSDVVGEWRIVESDNWNIYQPYDYWHFYSDGSFYVYRNDGGTERGVWGRSGRTLRISFHGSTDIEAYVSDYSGDYMVLDVVDYEMGSRYTLRCVRESYYSQKKKQGDNTSEEEWDE